MKLDGVSPGVAATSSEFHHLSHHGDEPSDTPSSRYGGGAGGGGWAVPSPRKDNHEDSKIHHHHRRRCHRDYTSTTTTPPPHLHQHEDRPPMSVVVVRGMPPLPNGPSTSSTPERYGSHWEEPAVARSYQPSNGYEGSCTQTGSEQMLSPSLFRLQPRTPTVIRSNRGGCRGRKRTAGGMFNPGSNAAVPTTIRAGCAMTVNTQHPLEENASTLREEAYPEVGLGLVGRHHSMNYTDVAVTTTPSSEPGSPHVLDAALITLRSLSLRSPGGAASPSLHEMMHSPNSIKRPRGSSFSVYTSSPAGSLPSATSTRPSTTCNSARSSPRVVPLTVLMADTSCNSSAAAPVHINEIKTPSRPPFLGVKLARSDNLEKRNSDKRSAAVSFESPLSSTNGAGTSPLTTPLPRISLTPRSSINSRESSLPVFPSPACLDLDDHYGDDDDDDDGEEEDGLPKFWLDGASPIMAPILKGSFDNNSHGATIPRPDVARCFESMMPRPSPRHEREMLVPPPPLKYPLAAACKFHHFGSSNSLALSADGSQDLNAQQHQPHMSPMDDTRPYTNSFLPFPHWLDSNHSRNSHGMQASPGTPLSSDSGPGCSDLPTPQHSNSCKQPSFPFGIDEEEDEAMFGVKSRSLLTGPSLLSTRHLLLHETMFEPQVNYSMDADTGSLSDSEVDEPFLLVSPKEIAEERLVAKRARLRRQWIGDSKGTDVVAAGSRNKLSVSSEGASNTSLFGMDIPHDEVAMSLLTFHPNSVSATSFPSQNAEDALEPSSLCRRRSDGSLGSLGLSLEIVSANANPFHATALNSGCCTGRDLVTPPIAASSKATELSPPPFAPKQDPVLLFAENSVPPLSRNSKPCFLSRKERHFNEARIKTLADCEGPLYDGGVDDDDDEASDSMNDE